jgi:pyocin large subunit-like protein
MMKEKNMALINRYVREFAKDIIEQIQSSKEYADSKILDDYIDEVNRAVTNTERGLITNIDAVGEILRIYKQYKRAMLNWG